MIDLIKMLPWDTIVFKRNILELSELFVCDKDSFLDLEKNYLSKYNPFMVFTKIDSTDINRIHFLEELGFRYIETQLHIQKKISDFYEIKLPIKINPVNIEDLDNILKITESTFDTDRYYIDPDFDSKISRERYANWIANNWNSNGYKLLKFEMSDNVIGFSFIKIENNVANYLLGGVASHLKGIGIGLHCNLCLNNYLKTNGIKVINTYISATNYAIFNIDMYMQYQVKDVKTILRKIY